MVINIGVHGLNDGVRKWYLMIKIWRFNQVKTEPAAFSLYHDGEFCGMFLMHVDDFLQGRTKRFENMVTAQILFRHSELYRMNMVSHFIKMSTANSLIL